MKKIAAVLGLMMLVLTVAVVDARQYTPTSEQLVAADDPDFLTLDPKGE
jgi:hypothetical protein